jgi:hypothetical protein
VAVVEDEVTVLLRLHYANLSHVGANLAHRALPIGLRGRRGREKSASALI